MYQKGRAWIELNMENLISNITQLQALLPGKGELMAVVKANAYGHGLSLMGNALQNHGIKNFCVASLSEGITLRKAGIRGQILILGYTSPHQFMDLQKYHLTQTIVDYSYAKEMNHYGYPLLAHIGIDSGMHRLGESSDNLEEIFKICQLPNLKITGIFSHLCVSDSLSESDIAFTLRQIEKFQIVVTEIQKKYPNHFKAHIQGSYGLLNYPDLQFDYARAGIALYGVLSRPEDQTVTHIDLKPVLTLKSRIECIRTLKAGESVGYGLTYTAYSDQKIAAVSIGYADGIPRELSNKGWVLLHGKKVPIVGRICMDQLLIDVSSVPEVNTGDEVVLIGRSGNREITAGDFAQNAGTITNEILCRLGDRLERIPS